MNTGPGCCPDGPWREVCGPSGLPRSLPPSSGRYRPVPIGYLTLTRNDRVADETLKPWRSAKTTTANDSAQYSEQHASYYLAKRAKREG